MPLVSMSVRSQAPQVAMAFVHHTWMVQSTNFYSIRFVFHVDSYNLAISTASRQMVVPLAQKLLLTRR